MKKIQTEWLLLGATVLSYFIMAISFLLMPAEKLKVLPGILFWGGLLSGVALLFYLDYRRKTFFKVNGGDYKKMQKARNGLMSFRSNIEATIADGVLLTSVVVTILAFVFTKGTGYICYVGVAATAFSVAIRCIFNGRIYHHVKNLEDTQAILEEMKASKKKRRRRRE